MIGWDIVTTGNQLMPDRDEMNASISNQRAGSEEMVESLVVRARSVGSEASKKGKVATTGCKTTDQDQTVDPAECRLVVMG